MSHVIDKQFKKVPLKESQRAWQRLLKTIMQFSVQSLQTTPWQQPYVRGRCKNWPQGPSQLFAASPTDIGSRGPCLLNETKIPKNAIRNQVMTLFFIAIPVNAAVMLYFIDPMPTLWSILLVVILHLIEDHAKNEKAAAHKGQTIRTR